MPVKLSNLTAVSATLLLLENATCAINVIKQICYVLSAPPQVCAVSVPQCFRLLYGAGISISTFSVNIAITI